MKGLFITILTALAVSISSHAQTDDYESFRNSMREEYSSFLNDAEKNYNSFRKRLNNDYAAFLADSNWTPTTPEAPVQRIKPRDNSLPPQRQPLPTAPAPRRDITIGDIILPEPLPEPPRPVEPIDYNPAPGEMRNVTVTIFGTPFMLPVPAGYTLNIGRLSASTIGEAWKQVSGRQSLDSTIGSLLHIRDEASLCDWAYYLLVKALGENIHSKYSAEAALLTAYIMNQSGYATRLAFDAPSNRLYAMLGTESMIFNQPYFPVGNVKYYPMETLGSVQIINADYPGTRPASMMVTRLPRLADSPAVRELNAKHIKALETSYTTNCNLMDFFDTYPASSMSDNNRSKWAYYSAAPLSSAVCEAIYPKLREAMRGKSQREAADVLMDYCESIPYAYDDDVWGYDRAFFPDESLHYLKGDCEDHAILFVRLVRDLMGLDAALLYFPNHLAAAVRFTEDVPGDYITYGGERWTVCDPTIFYSGVGHIMNTCDPTKASFIPLTGLK